MRMVYITRDAGQHRFVPGRAGIRGVTALVAVEGYDRGGSVLSGLVLSAFGGKEPQRRFPRVFPGADHVVRGNTLQDVKRTKVAGGRCP